MHLEFSVVTERESISNLLGPPLPLLHKSFNKVRMASSVLVLRRYDMVDSTMPFVSLISDRRPAVITNLYGPSDPELPDPELPGYAPAFAGCCNGLICVQYHNLEYALWNPKTNQFKRLPPIDIDVSSQCPSRSCNKMCYVSRRSSSCCLGYDPTSQDYKFVAFITIYYEDRENYHHISKKVALYSLKTDSWKEIEYTGARDMRDGNAIRINEICYWSCEAHIVSFSFTTEKFSSLPFPDIILNEKYEYVPHLVEIEGTLGIVVYPRYGNEKLFSFLVLRGGSWARKTELDVRLVGARKLLGLFYGNLLLLEGRDGELLEYDYKKKELDRIDQIYDYPLEMCVFPYVEMTTPLPNGKIAASTLEDKTREEIKRQKQ